MIIIFPDLPTFEGEGVEEAEEITLILRTTSPTALCPSCGAASSRVQSRYTRTLRDLPSVGYPIRLIMRVRRFFCKYLDRSLTQPASYLAVNTNIKWLLRNLADADRGMLKVWGMGICTFSFLSACLWLVALAV